MASDLKAPPSLPPSVATYGKLTRDEKVENLVTNFSMIMMGIFEGAFTAMATTMTTALTKAADALTEAMDQGGGSPAKKPKAERAKVDVDVGSKMKEVFAGLRKEVSAGFSNKGEKFKRFIKDPAFDAGVLIVERHQFKLPRLTERLTDAELAGYVDLIQNGDPEVSKMMQELGNWQKTTPSFGH